MSTACHANTSHLATDATCAVLETHTYTHTHTHALALSRPGMPDLVYHIF
jgi:hypothetical protein